MLAESKALTEWVNSQKKLYDGLPCKLQNILSADVTEAYRNKCEFTVGDYLQIYKQGYKSFARFNLLFFNDTGKDSKQSKIIIGFRLSTYASGSTAVGPIDDLCHIPENMKVAVKVNFDYRFFFIDVTEMEIHLENILTC